MCSSVHVLVPAFLPELETLEDHDTHFLAISFSISSYNLSLSGLKELSF